jgi:cytochrome P460
MTKINTFAATTAFTLIGGAAFAQDCAVDVESPFDLEEAQIVEIYDCMKDKMIEGYSKQGSMIAKNYRNWTVSGTRPAVAGPHGERLLLTFVNPIGAEEYLKFAEEGVAMPAGSVIAKESIKISAKKKQARIGPLFLMTKLKSGEAPDTDDWRYDGLQPNGKSMKFKQSFCHDCHTGWEAQDSLAYPLEEVRVSN